MSQNPIDAVLGSAPAAPQNSVPSPTPPTQAEQPAAVSSNPIDIALSSGSSPSPSPFSGSQPSSDNSESPQPAVDPNEGFFGKAWRLANTPLTESVFGMSDHREGAGGIERGVEKIASGFTSPLSIALTLATFGTAGFLESAGANVLRDAGLGAAEIADVGKGAQVVADARKAGLGIDSSLEAAGINPTTFHTAMDTLYKSGLQESDLLGGNLVERGVSTIARKFGTTPAKAQNIAKGLQTLASAGFAGQAGVTAAEMSPRVLDALKDGDYDKAAEYATEAVANGLFAAAGASHTLRSAGELAEPLIGAKLRPTDESTAFKKQFGIREADHEQANQNARLLEEDAMKQLGHKDPLSPLTSEDTIAGQNKQLAKMYHAITLGFDKDLAAEHFNAIAEAAGRDDRLPVEGSPENGQAEPHTALPENLKQLIAESPLKDKPKEYIDDLLDAYKGVHDGLSEVEMNVAKQLRDSLNKGLEDAHTNGLIKNGVENYMRRVWKKENPVANSVIADANNGRFTTSVSMAKRRVFGSELEGLLRGYELASRDPVRLTAQWGADAYKAIANRNLESRLLDRGIRGSDNRPAAVLSGLGQAVEGSDGQNPVTLITPQRVRNISIADNEIQRLKQSGDLERHLASGSIVDLTPTAHKWNADKFIDRLEQKAISAPAQYDAQDNNILRKQIEILKGVRDGKLPESALDEINAAQKPVYVWRPQDYVKIDHPSLRDWNFLTNDPSGNPVIVKSDLMVHPEYAQYFKNRLALEDSALQKWGPTKALLKGGNKVKKTLLSLSPFHLNQEALRAVMLGVNPIMKAAPTIENSPTLRSMVENGLTLEPDYRAIQMHSEGLAEHSKLIDKIPGVGKTLGKSLDWFEDFLFKKYIPNLKARASVKLFEEYQDAHPEWTKDKVAEVAARHVNDTFGGQNWKALGRSTATQDWARLVLLAPDWLESEMRSAARVFDRDEGGIGRAQVAKMAMGMWGVARVLNLLTTGKPHFEAPFGVATRSDDGKETVYSIRTLPTDILHMASDPVGFLKGRLSPTVRAAQEVYSGRDQYGRKLAPGDMAIDLFHNVMPLPLQSIGKITGGAENPNVDNTAQVAKAAGFTAQVFRTEAAKKAAELASNHSEDGPLDPAVLHRHQVIMHFEDQLRSGKISLPQVQNLVISGQLPQADYKKMVKNLQQTRDMDSTSAALYTRASRLPTKELLEVYDLATPSEKQVLSKLVVDAKRKYVKKSLTDMTPSERMADPTLKKLMNMFPQAPAF